MKAFSVLLGDFLKNSLIKVWFQNFFYFSGYKLLLVLNVCPLSSRALTQTFMSGF